MQVRLIGLAGNGNGSSTEATLGDALGSGGEGSVYRIAGDDARAAKLYADPPDDERIAKLRAMIASNDDALAAVAAWPDGLVAVDDRIAGFTMPRLRSQLPLHELFGPRRRQELFPDAHWTFLVHAAANVARAFETLHRRDIVIGDVNSNNVVIYPTSKTRLIDCDSFQIERDGIVYRSTVGVPDYQPPELQAADLAEAPRTVAADRFGLAVLIFQLLFVGKHPFAGIVPPDARGDASIGGNIAAGRFFYADDAATRGLRPPPGSLTLDALPEPFPTLFTRAFAMTPDARPSASEWHDALRALEAAIVPCERSRRHRFVGGVACPWCALEDAGLFYFAPHADDRVPIDESPWRRFPDHEVERVWDEIAAVAAPPRADDPVPARPPRPSLWQRTAAALARVRGGADARATLAARRGAYEETRRRFERDRARWRELASAAPFGLERARLQALRDRLRAQRADREREFAIAHQAQRQLDHATFLQQFPIPYVAQVRGSLVTPSGPTTGIENRQQRELARHGITNAWHVTPFALRQVPLLRSWRYDVLMEWRATLDAQFATFPVRDLDLRTRKAIEARYAAERDEAATAYAAGPEVLRALAGEIERERAELAARLPEAARAMWAAERALLLAPLTGGTDA